MSDYPLTLAGCHGRIAAYRHALRLVDEALLHALPYVHAQTHSDQPWRRETAEVVVSRLREARDCIAAELAVTNGPQTTEG